MFYVYILWSESTKHTYVGSTEDVAQRLRRHNCGHSRSTKSGMPWQLLYTERFDTRAEAVRREKYFKTGHGRLELKSPLKPPV